MDCTVLYFGRVRDMIIHSTAPMTSVTATKMSDSFISISIAMTIAPTTINGARRIRRINIATPCCA